MNAILIFGVFGAPWLLDPDHLVVWAPLSLAAVALVPPVRGSAHQLVDIVRRRLQGAWGGRPNAAAGPGFDARQQQESAGELGRPWGVRGRPPRRRGLHRRLGQGAGGREGGGEGRQACQGSRSLGRPVWDRGRGWAEETGSSRAAGPFLRVSLPQVLGWLPVTPNHASARACV